jgi:hypothetical protein
MEARSFANWGMGKKARAEGEGEMKPAPGLKFQAWTAEDDDRLKSLIEASVSIDLIAARMERTTQGVKSRASTLGHINQTGMGWAEGEGEAMKRPPIGTSTWTEADDAKLRSLVVAGLSSREIATELIRDD